VQYQHWQLGLPQLLIHHSHASVLISLTIPPCHSPLLTLFSCNTHCDLSTPLSCSGVTWLTCHSLIPGGHGNHGGRHQVCGGLSKIKSCTCRDDEVVALPSICRAVVSDNQAKSCICNDGTTWTAPCRPDTCTCPGEVLPVKFGSRPQICNGDRPTSCKCEDGREMPTRKRRCLPHTCICSNRKKIPFDFTSNPCEMCSGFPPVSCHCKDGEIAKLHNFNCKYSQEV